MRDLRGQVQGEEGARGARQLGAQGNHQAAGVPRLRGEVQREEGALVASSLESQLRSKGQRKRPLKALNLALGSLNGLGDQDLTEFSDKARIIYQLVPSGAFKKVGRDPMEPGGAFALKVPRN